MLSTSLTLKKVTTKLYSIDDEQLKDMLSCLRPGTHVKISPPLGLKKDYLRQYKLIGDLCQKRNLYLEIDAYYLTLDLNRLPNRFLGILPPQTRSLTGYVFESTARNEASCRRLIRAVLDSPLRSTILHVFPTEEAKRNFSTVIQELPETHEAILELFEAKPKRVIIRRRD